MTRRSKRELERAIDDLVADAQTDDPDTDGFDVSAPFVEYGEEADPDADIVAEYQIVMRRDRAEREGREILGPADGPGDLVRVGDTET